MRTNSSWEPGHWRHTCGKTLTTRNNSCVPQIWRHLLKCSLTYIIRFHNQVVEVHLVRGCYKARYSSVKNFKEFQVITAARRVHPGLLLVNDSSGPFDYQINPLSPSLTLSIARSWRKPMRTTKWSIKAPVIIPEPVLKLKAISQNNSGERIHSEEINRCRLPHRTLQETSTWTQSRFLGFSKSSIKSFERERDTLSLSHTNFVKT